MDNLFTHTSYDNTYSFESYIEHIETLLPSYDYVVWVPYEARIY